MLESELIKEILKLGPDPIYLFLFYEKDPAGPRSIYPGFAFARAHKLSTLVEKPR
jgi:hypothetical protein